MDDQTLMPLAFPYLGPEEEQAVLEVLRSGAIATGPRTVEFEQAFARYLGRRFAVGTDSCTNALHIALRALGIGEGDEVITTPLTFVATANAILYAGARPVFVDVDPHTLNLDPGAVASALTPRTRALLPVHLYGHPCEMDPLLDLARRHRLRVVSDCAHAIEAEYRGTRVGALGDVACFSFYATKNLTTGNGGMLATDDPEVDRLARILRDHGMHPEAWGRYRTGEFQHYAMTHLGYKCIMWDLQAALGLCQLRRLEERHRRREELARLYDALLEPLAEWVRPLPRRPWVRHAFHLYPVRVHGVDRDRLAQELLRQGIGVGVHYRPVHLEPYYRERFRFREGMFPVAEEAGRTLLSLPFWPEMGEERVERVVRALRQALDRLAVRS